MNRNQMKKLLGTGGILLCAAGAGIFLFLQTLRPTGGMAEVRYDGRLAAVIPLDRDQIFVLPEDPTVRLEVREGKIRFIDAVCPDKICESAGYLSRVGDTAACLPRKTVVTITEGEEREADLIAG